MTDQFNSLSGHPSTWAAEVEMLRRRVKELETEVEVLREIVKKLGWTA